MRKSFAILFLSVHVFSLGGYWLVLNYFEHKADRSFIQNLDNNQYDEADLVTIQLPLNLPYTGNQHEFVRCNGTISINGVFYNYVKRKFFNDTLTLLCIANQEKTRLYAANNEYARSAGDAQSPSSSHEKAMSSLLNSLLAGYKYEDPDDLLVFFTKASSGYRIPGDQNLCSSFIPGPTQPPEIL